MALGRQNGGGVFLGREIASDRDFSDETAATIDAEVRKLVDQSYIRAKEVLINNRHILDKLSQILCEKETVDAEELQELLATNEVTMAAIV